MSKLKIRDGNTWVEVPAGGVGVPSGGTQGQVLVKTGSADYATGWETREATVFQLGAGASGITHFGVGIYDPNTSTVRIYMTARSTSNISSSTTLAIVPAAYCPRENKALYGMMSSESVRGVAYYGIVDVYGNITQKLGNTPQEVFLCGEYVI